MYKKILVAIDLSKDSQKVVDAAVRMAEIGSSNLHLAHVVEPIADVYSMEIYTANIKQMEPSNSYAENSDSILRINCTATRYEC